MPPRARPAGAAKRIAPPRRKNNQPAPDSNPMPSIDSTASATPTVVQPVMGPPAALLIPPRPPTPIVDPSLLTPSRVSPPIIPQPVPTVDLNLIMEQMRRMQDRLDRAEGNGQQAQPLITGDGAGQAAGAQPIQNAAVVHPGSVPKPKGSAGGGKKGFHLQEEMGLDTGEGHKQYNMILSTVRELAHAARLDLSQPYRAVSAENLTRIFSMARKIHPYLARFQNDWATAEILKQFMSSTRRYGKRKGYFTPTEDADRNGSRRRLDDME